MGNVYQQMFGGKYKQIGGEVFSVSYLSVLKIPEVRLLIGAGSLIVSANHLGFLL
jgi:hypothetical protein